MLIRLPDDGLEDDHQHPAAVEGRERQDVHEREVGRQDRRPGRASRAALLPEHVADLDRDADRAGDAAEPRLGGSRWSWRSGRGRPMISPNASAVRATPSSSGLDRRTREPIALRRGGACVMPSAPVRPRRSGWGPQGHSHGAQRAVGADDAERDRLAGLATAARRPGAAGRRPGNLVVMAPIDRRRSPRHPRGRPPRPASPAGPTGTAARTAWPGNHAVAVKITNGQQRGSSRRRPAGRRA